MIKKFCDKCEVEVVSDDFGFVVGMSDGVFCEKCYVEFKEWVGFD